MRLAKNPLLSVNYIYIINFLSQLNKEKKWESGQKCLKPPIYALKLWPFSFLKVAKNPLFLTINYVFRPYNSQNPF